VKRLFDTANCPIFKDISKNCRYTYQEDIMPVTKKTTAKKTTVKKPTAKKTTAAKKKPTAKKTAK